MQTNTSLPRSLLILNFQSESSSNYSLRGVYIATTDKGKMSYSQSVVKHDASAQQFEVETRRIVNQTLYVLLADEGVIMNQSRRGKCDGDKDVVGKGLIGACKKMLATHREELRVQLDQQDLSPSALCMSYHQLANGLLEDGCNWGKVVMLFTAAFHSVRPSSIRPVS